MSEAKPFHVLWFTENYPPSPGGMAVSCDRIVRGLREQGVWVDVIQFARQLPAARVDIQHNGRHFAWPLGEDPAHALNLLYERLAADPLRARYSHVVAFGGHFPILATPTIAAWLGVPLITLLRGNDFDSAVFSPQRAPMLRDALLRSARVCVVSRDREARVRALHPALDVQWTPNGIDLDGWSPLPSDLLAARAWRAAEVAPGRRVLGLFGQIKPKKGGLLLLDSLQQAGLAEHIHLLLVGDLDTSLEARLGAADSPFSFTALPFCDRYALLRHYCACDAIAIPSAYDGMPNVLLEAMGLGIPLLATSTGGMADLLSDETHAFLFSPGDPHGCHDALMRFIQADAEKLTRMGAACRERVAEFSPSRETHHYLQALQASAR